LRFASARSRGYCAERILALFSTGISMPKAFAQGCALGCEGIVSKRLGSPYRAGRVDHWRKIKNPAAPAVKREAEED
jgi:ATP-dependent DNA ligase